MTGKTTHDEHDEVLLMTKTRTGALLMAAGLAVAVIATSSAAQQIRTPRQTPFPQNPNFDSLEVETLHVQGNV
jgi:hypothetical protein